MNADQHWTKTLELRTGVAAEYIAGHGSTRVFNLDRKEGRVFIVVALGIRDYYVMGWAAIGSSTIMDERERREREHERIDTLLRL